MDILITIASKVAECALTSIGHQLSYLVFYDRNIKDVGEKVKDLEATRREVERRIKDAESNGNEILKEVSKWVEKVNDELPSSTAHENEGGSNGEAPSNPSCFNLLQRYQLSRRAKKRVEVILELIEKGNNFHQVGFPAPLPITKRFTPSDDYQVLESRTLIAKQIKDALADPNINKVGIHGMGGVGKTKLLDEVKKLVLEDRLFDRVIEVTVGQSIGEIEIQEQIANKLNIQLSQKSKEGRASFLHNKLTKMKDNILVMLDDLWKEYDLIKEVGIPCHSKLSKEGCKILMTSRSRDKLTNMGSQIFLVKSLSEEEAWKFFMTIIGDKFDRNRMEHVAKEVVKKCGGLPIALKIIASLQ